MKDKEKLNDRYETIAYGAIFILFGSLLLIPGDQKDIFVLGIGLILVGLNLTRLASQIPINGFSTILGVSALAFGLLALLRPIFGWGFRLELTIIPVFFVATGLYFLISGAKRTENA